MSRVREYDDSWDDGIAALLNGGRWERNTRATLTSRRGQAVLRELEAALLALPVQRLAADTFCAVGEDDSQVEACVLGALALYRGKAAAVPDVFNAPEDEEEYGDPADEQAKWAAEHLGIAYTLAWNLIDRNDEIYARCTPEERYTRMLAFVRSQMKPAPATDATEAQNASRTPPPNPISASSMDSAIEVKQP